MPLQLKEPRQFERELFDSQETARLLNVSIGSVISYSKSGTLPSVLINRRHKFRWADIEKFIADRRVKVAA